MDPISTIFGILNGIRTLITGESDADRKAQLELAAKQLEATVESMKAQTAVNAVEAASTDPFVSRWRPFIGWVCGVAFAYHFILQPVLVLLLLTAGKKIALPVFDLGTLMPVLLGMLGLGAMRSYDKVQMSKSK